MAVIDHSVHMDAVTHVYGQDHSEEACAQKGPCLHSEQENRNMLKKKKVNFKLFFKMSANLV